jgi:predicted site-specific integrase-resolvase
VSSAKQSEDLQRQIDFMKKIFPGYDVISDIASGVNFNRNGLNKLIERICNDEIGVIAVSFKDRLARIGFEIIEHLCNIHKCEIIVVNNIETSPEAELVEDLIAITTSFSARIHGLRKYSTKFTTKFSDVEDS